LFSYHLKIVVAENKLDEFSGSLRFLAGEIRKAEVGKIEQWA
jgi:hypothetical protein